MMRRRRGPALTLAAGCASVLLAAGCSQDDEDYGVPEYDPSATTTEASTTPTSAATTGPVDLDTVAVPTDLPEDVYAPVVVQDITPEDVGGEEQYEVVVAWVVFWRTITAQYAVPRFDEAALRQVATGPVLDSYLDDIPAAVSEGRRIVDFTDLWPNTVTIEGDTAQLYDCQISMAYFVDSNNNPIETPLGEVAEVVELVRVDNKWLVNNFQRTECPIDASR